MSDSFQDHLRELMEERGATEMAMPKEEMERLQREHAQRVKHQKEQERLAQQRTREEFKRLLPIRNKLPFSDELAQELCERVSAGELVIDITNENHMPTLRRLNQWLRDNAEFQELYAQSIQDRLSIFEEQVIQIADDVERDYKEITMRTGHTKRVVDPEVIARAKLRVDVRFRHLKAGKPTKWGDSQTLNVKSEDEFDPSSYTPEELERQIADIEKKSRIVRSV